MRLITAFDFLYDQFVHATFFAVVNNNGVPFFFSTLSILFFIWPFLYLLKKKRNVVGAFQCIATAGFSHSLCPHNDPFCLLAVLYNPQMLLCILVRLSALKYHHQTHQLRSIHILRCLCCRMIWYDVCFAVAQVEFCIYLCVSTSRAHPFRAAMPCHVNFFKWFDQSAVFFSYLMALLFGSPWIFRFFPSF